MITGLITELISVFSSPKKAHPNIYFSTTSPETWRQAVLIWQRHSADFIIRQPQRPCPACASRRNSFSQQSYDGHHYHVCEDCGCLFVPYLVDEAFFASFRAQRPEAADLAEAMARERLCLSEELDEQRFASLLDRLAPFKPGAVLDIGANAGQFVGLAQSRGISAWGLENSPYALAEARRLKHPVAERLSDIPDLPFEILTLWETLEHVADPLALLTEALPRLTEQGLVALTVPNLDSIQVRLMRGDNPHVHGGCNTPGHINFFGPKQLELLLKRAGLVPLFYDSLYSSDYAMLYAWLTGSSQGARDALRDAPPFTYPSGLDALAPYLYSLERKYLAGQILFCLACRPQARAGHEALAKTLEARRLEDAAEEQAIWPEQRIPFNIPAPGRFQVIISGGNITAAPVCCMLSRLDIYGPTNIPSGHTDLLPECKFSRLVGRQRRGQNSSLLFAAENIRFEYLALSEVLPLQAGAYELLVRSGNIHGQCVIGVLDVVKDCWLFNTRPLCPALPWEELLPWLFTPAVEQG